ncbi:hypothetical protein H2199_009119 [Coniosporium tulheliwenetii]|uniref:Uncharacterized protein n=1 Tax=Coniosporium tulheliwenetii TaxID=3383036 RepID=A0ACC2YFF7_9PEZI|nr:hypothetical protein H2199_009119 [Cladosporium sp. JES 115]
MTALPSTSVSNDYRGPQPALPEEEETAENLDGYAALMRMEAKEENRLLEEQQESILLDEELEHDENTDWLRGCGWPTWFANRPFHLITAAARVPSLDLMRDLQMGPWNGMACVSPAASERVL